MEQDKKRSEEDVSSQDKTNEPQSIYENFNQIPIRVLDVFIGLCIAAFVILIAVGVMNR